MMNVPGKIIIGEQSVPFRLNPNLHVQVVFRAELTTGIPESKGVCENGQVHPVISSHPPLQTG